MEETTFNKESIDIIKTILQSPQATGPYRGKEVSNFLDDKIDNLNQHSLMVIDITKAFPLEYSFCQYAFGPLLKNLQENKLENKRILFQLLEEDDEYCFFRGVLKHIDMSISRHGSISSAKTAFIESGKFTMIKRHGESDIQFIAKLSEVEQRILDFVNEKRSATDREISATNEKFELEVITDSLRSLKQKGFIVQSPENNNHFHSIYNYLQNSNQNDS